MDGEEVSGLDDSGVFTNTPADKNDLEDPTEGADNHYNVNIKGDYKASDITATVTSIKADGQEIEFDASKIKCGNIENNNNCYRIEIYNSYGTTATDAPIDPLGFTFEDTLEVTFTIEGLGEVKQFPEVTPFFGDAAAAGDDAAADESATEEDAAADEDAAAE